MPRNAANKPPAPSAIHFVGVARAAALLAAGAEGACVVGADTGEGDWSVLDGRYENGIEHRIRLGCVLESRRRIADHTAREPRIEAGRQPIGQPVFGRAADAAGRGRSNVSLARTKLEAARVVGSLPKNARREQVKRQKTEGPNVCRWADRLSALRLFGRHPERRPERRLRRRRCDLGAARRFGG